MSYKYNLAIASCFRDEILFIREWLNYHILLGVEHFYLANNDFDKRPGNALLLPYIKRGLVTLIPDCEISLSHYRIMPKLLNLATNEAKWVAIIDIDEFLYPQKQNFDIYNNVILNYEFADVVAIAINHCTFGSGNIVFHQESVTQSYFKRAFKEDSCNKTTKLIIRPEFVCEPKGHSFVFNGGLILNTLFEDVTANNLGKFKTEKIVWDVLRLNHYPVKSLEDFLKKCKRGFMGKIWTMGDHNFWYEYFTEYNKNDQKDLGMLFVKDMLCIT